MEVTPPGRKGGDRADCPITHHVYSKYFIKLLAML